MQNSKALEALRKIASQQQLNLSRMDQERAQKQENDLMNRLIGAMDKMGSVTSFVGPPGEKGDTPIRGIDYFTEQDVRILLAAATPVKNKDYFDGEKGDTGENGMDGSNGRDGIDGSDGVANMDEVDGAIDESMSAHMKECNHALIHDSKMIGGLEVDVASIQEGDILQRQGNKLVGIKLPQAQIIGNYNASQGVSNVRSYPVTSNTELEAMGIYVVDATAGNITITIPSAAGRENYWFELIRIDGTANTVTIVPTGSETMSGMTDYIMQQWTDVKLFAYNGNYLIRQAS